MSTNLQAPSKDQKILLQILATSLVDMAIKDADLFVLNTHEQAFSHRLAVYLEKNFNKALPFFDRTSYELVKVTVDCEYNRHENDKKILHNILLKYPNKLSNIVRPDIVVHVRGQSANLLVVEVTKGKELDFEYAFDKVSEFVCSDYSYELGAVVYLSANGYIRIATVRRSSFNRDNQVFLSLVNDKINNKTPSSSTNNGGRIDEDEATEFRPWSPEVNEYWEDMYN